MSQSEDAVVECPKCHYIHIGTDIQGVYVIGNLCEYLEDLNLF